MQIICKDCGKPLSRDVYGGLCQGCWRYYRSGGTVNEIPPHGVISHDHRGCVVCHICGKAFKRLGSHIRESHNMTIEEYKECFGLCANARTTEAQYSRKMRDNAYKYDMPNRLQVTGKNTQIKKGDKSKRLGKPTRLQESLDKRERMLVYMENKRQANSI